MGDEQISVTALDDAVAAARGEALELIRCMAEGVVCAVDAIEPLIAGSDEFDAPVDWPLPKDLVLERCQLVAFVAAMATLPAETRDAVRAAYAPELEKAKATAGMRSTAELPTAPALPETRGAYAELRTLAEEARRMSMWDRDLSDALRVLIQRRFASSDDGVT